MTAVLDRTSAQLRASAAATAAKKPTVESDSAAPDSCASRSRSPAARIRTNMGMLVRLLAGRLITRSMAVTPPASTRQRLTAPVCSRHAFISAARAISHASPWPRQCEAALEPPPTQDETRRSSPSAGACDGAAPTPAMSDAVEFDRAEVVGGVGRAKRVRNSSEKSKFAIAPATASRPVRYAPGSAAEPVASSDDASSPATSSGVPGVTAALGPCGSAFFFFPVLPLPASAPA
mmetsp:Transcript_19579/g.41095  ORF Transcript_19579/g.41095 Transcript_19579/m.41095 type:complete len:234 (-) Transcript_19579:2072-2773(-)